MVACYWDINKASGTLKWHLQSMSNGRQKGAQTLWAMADRRETKLHRLGAPMPTGFTLFTTWLLWDLGKLQFWYRLWTAGVFTLDLFWSVLFNISQFFAFSIIGSISYSHSPQPPSQKIHSSDFIFRLQNIVSYSFPTNHRWLISSSPAFIQVLLLLLLP